MTIDVFNIKESWIFTNENRPSQQLFNYIISNSATEPLTADFTDGAFDTFNIKIQIGVKDIFSFNYNLVRLNNGYYYVVKDFKMIQLNILEISATLDNYLTFLLPLYDEKTTDTTMVFFKQKHLNRWMYTADSVNTINYSKQFYLKNTIPELSKLGAQLEKIADIANNSWFNLAEQAQGLTNSAFYGETKFNYTSRPLLQFGDGNYGYAYALLTMTPNESNQLMNLNGIAWNALWNVTYSAYNSADWNSLAWWQVLEVLPKDAYADIIVLPVAIEYGNLVYNDQPNGGQWPWSTAQDYTNNSQLSSVWGQLVLPVNPGYIYYLPENGNASELFTCYNEFQQIFNIEPYILSFCKYRIRGAGEDCFVDFTLFDNVTPDTWGFTLHSFVIAFNHPVTQITSLPLQYYNNSSCMVPYGYNSVTDVYWVINWKLTYPSLSDNWTNYLANNLNQYHVALNIAHYQLQNAQLNIASQFFSGLTSASDSGLRYGGLLSDLQEAGVGMGGLTAFGVGAGLGGLSMIGNTITSLFGSFNQEHIQQAEYNYLKSGKKGDMSRVANERLAVNNNAVAYQNYLLSFVFEYPVKFEQIQIINYCILNGYVLEKWDQWQYWNNRKFCNYVKCNFFSDIMLPSLLQPYKRAIDKMMLTGIRIWNLASAAISSPTLNIGAILINDALEYANVELNENNNEIILLSNT